METKEEILKRLGKKDGHDEIRWETACNMAQEQDRHVNFCFESILKLEDKGLIQLQEVKNDFEICTCECHTDENIRHMMPCCCQCKYCGENIKIHSFDSHKERCKQNSSEQYSSVFNQSFPDIEFKDIIKQNKDVYVILPKVKNK